MKSDEFLELRGDFKEGDEVKIRYYTYNRKDYIDVFGKIFTMYGGFSKENLHLSIEYLGTYKIHDRFTGKNFPMLRLSGGLNNEVFCHIKPCEIIFIKPASLRAYKIHQLRTKKVNDRSNEKNPEQMSEVLS